MLTGSIVRLRPLAPSDAPTVARWDEEVDVARTHQSGVAVPQGVERHTSWITDDTTSPSTHAFGVVRIADAALIGRAALSGISWQHGHAELGIALTEEAQTLDRLGPSRRSALRPRPHGAAGARMADLATHEGVSARLVRPPEGDAA